MVFIFKEKEALDYLLENGFVIILRNHILKDNGGAEITAEMYKGLNWITAERGRRKIANVEIRWWGNYYFISSMTENQYTAWRKELKNYAEDSGFQVVDKWIEAIRRQNDGELPLFGYLYRIEIIGFKKTLLVTPSDI